jgi:hyperosmotically inducible periplasmic protein
MTALGRKRSFVSVCFRPKAVIGWSTNYARQQFSFDMSAAAQSADAARRTLAALGNFASEASLFNLRIGHAMKTKLAASFLIAGALLLPIAGHTADSDSDRSSPKAFVKDSAITAKIKTELAGEKMSSLVHISVDTDKKGMVTLSGSATSQNAVDKAVSIARAVHGVTNVQSNIEIKAD